MIPTAKEFFLKKIFPSGNVNESDLELYLATNDDLQRDISIAIEFAKLYVKAALEAAANECKLHIVSNYGTYERSKPDNSDLHTICEEKAINNYGHGDCTYEKIYVDKDSILNAYPETLIK